MRSGLKSKDMVSAISQVGEVAQNAKTQARIAHTLTTGKPLRN